MSRPTFLRRAAVSGSAAVLALTLISSGALPVSAATGPVTVSVNAATVLQTGTTGGARLGNNLDYWWDDQANRLPGARTTAAALVDMGANVWRYPGGEKADGMLWAPPPYTDGNNPRLARVSSRDWPSNDARYWTPTGDPSGSFAHPVYSFDEFMADCLAAGCTPVIVTAYDGIYKPANQGGTSLTRQQALEMGKAWVHYANNIKGYGIKYWEIGNETWNPGYMGGTPPNDATWAADVKEFCINLKSADSMIHCGVNADTQPQWEALLQGAGANLDFLAVHSYDTYRFGTYDDYRLGSINLTNLNGAWNALQKFPTHANRIKLAVTETGGITYGLNNTTWTDADLGHALMTFDTLAQYQQDSRVEFTQIWNTRFLEQNHANNAFTYPKSEYDTLKADNTFNAQGMAANILGDYSLEQMVATTSTADVRVFATTTPSTGKMNIFLINKNLDSTPATINLQNWAGAKYGTVSSLSGSSWSDMNPTFAQRGTIGASNDQLSLTLEKHSLTVISLNATAPDTTPPSVPGQLTATGTTGWSTNLSWTASTDDVGVAGYEVLRNGTVVATVSGTTYTAGGLAPATTYTFNVRAKDSSGNLSANSNTVSAATASTPAGQISNPGFEAGAVSPWLVGGNAGYTGSSPRTGAYAGFVTGTGSLSQVITGLQPNSTYTVRVWVRAASGSETVFLGVKNHGSPEVTTKSSRLGTTYTQIARTFTTGSTSTSAEIFLRKSSSTTAVMDDWTLS